MNKILIALAVSAVLPVAAQAQNAPGAGFYLGAGTGASKLSIDSSSGFSQSGSTGNETYGKFFGGFQFNDYFGLEGGYSALGTFKSQYVYEGIPVSLRTKTDATYFAVTGTYPLGQGFAVFGKLGVTGNHTSISATASDNGQTGTAADSGNKSSGYGSLGLSYDFTKNWSVAVEAEDFGKVADDAKAYSYGVSVKYKF